MLIKAKTFTHKGIQTVHMFGKYLQIPCFRIN